jgi:hypothetical protein
VREYARLGPRSHPPAKPRGQDHARHRRPGARRRAPAPSPASSRTRAGPCVATAGPTAQHGRARSPAPARTAAPGETVVHVFDQSGVPQDVTHVVTGDAMLAGAHQHGHQRSGLRDPAPAGPGGGTVTRGSNCSNGKPVSPGPVKLARTGTRTARPGADTTATGDERLSASTWGPTTGRRPLRSSCLGAVSMPVTESRSCSPAGRTRSMAAW